MRKPFLKDIFEAEPMPETPLLALFFIFSVHLWDMVNSRSKERLYRLSNLALQKNHYLLKELERCGKTQRKKLLAKFDRRKVGKKVSVIAYFYNGAIKKNKSSQLLWIRTNRTFFFEPIKQFSVWNCWSDKKGNIPQTCINLFKMFKENCLNQINTF